MESADAKEVVPASVAVEISNQRIKEEPSFLHEELSSTNKAVEENTLPITTNEFGTSSREQDKKQNAPNEREAKEEPSTYPTALSNDKAIESTAEEHPQNDGNVSSTATTPERPNNQTRTLSPAQTTTAKTKVKEEPCTLADIPDGFFDDLLLTADQISEQMSPPHIKEEENCPMPMPNQLASTSSSAAVNESIPSDTPNNNIEAPGKSGDAAHEAIPDRAAAHIKIKNEHNIDEVGDGEADVADAEAIPDDFFDDLLEDRVAKRIEVIQNEEEEIKYSEKIKQIQQQLRELDEIESSTKHKKHKHKKSKKKSHKHTKNKEDKDCGEVDVSLDDNDSEEVQRKRRKHSRSPAQSLHEDDHEEIQRKRRKHNRSPAQRLDNDDVEEMQRKNRRHNRSPVQRLDDDDFEEMQRHRRRHSRSPITTRKSNYKNYENLSKVAPSSALTFNETIYQKAAVNYPTLGAPEELPGSSFLTNFPRASVPVDIPNSSTAFSPFPLPFMVKPEPSILIPDAENDAFDCLPVEQPSNSSAFNAFSVEMPTTKLNIKTEDNLPVAPVTKRQKALDQAAKAIKQLELAQKNPNSSEFYFTSTVRKLPTSSSYVTQQIYDNRSPLHTINNVDFAFNSNSTRFNLHEWGLEAMPKAVAKVAKVIGYDADSLFVKLKGNKNTKIFSRKIKKEINVGEAIDETKSSFFTNAMTQTDDVVIGSVGKRKGHDIGMQATPARASLGTQTTFSTSTAGNNDLPLMRQINQLNENQLLALNDFAELMLERNSSTAVDMYSLRQRMLEIYKCSQMSPAVPGPAPARASASATIASNHNSRYQNTSPTVGPTNVVVEPNLNYQNNAQPVYRSISNTVSNVHKQYLQPNPAAAPLNQIPVHLTHPLQPQQTHQLPSQQPHHLPPQQPLQLPPQPQQPIINHAYQVADPRINAGFPMQPINPEYQMVPPSNYKFTRIPPNPVAPPSDSGIKYYGRGGMRR